VALDPFQEEIIHDMVNVQEFNLIEYRLVFSNNSVNPLTHSMKHVFKVSRQHYNILLSESDSEIRNSVPGIFLKCRLSGAIFASTRKETEENYHSANTFIQCNVNDTSKLISQATSYHHLFVH